MKFAMRHLQSTPLLPSKDVLIDRRGIEKQDLRSSKYPLQQLLGFMKDPEILKYALAKITKEI